jgi:hypothetical protein
MNYKLNKTKTGWEIIENNTNQIIQSFVCYMKAKKKLKHFNSGGGFDSWTPSFFLIKIPKT